MKGVTCTIELVRGVDGTYCANTGKIGTFSGTTLVENADYKTIKKAIKA